MCTLAGRYVDGAASVHVADASGGARALQVRAGSFPVAESAFSFQVQDGAFSNAQQQFVDVMLPGNGYSNTDHGTSYSAALPPSLPLPWSHGLSSDADYYGHGMVGIERELALLFS